MPQKLLFIIAPIDEIPSGTSVTNKKNIEALREVLGVDNVVVREIAAEKNLLSRIVNKLTLYVGGMNARQENDIIRQIISNGYSYCFISQSLFGRLVRKIKKKQLSVQLISFFHNIEVHYAREFVRVGGISHLPFLWAAIYNEKLTVKYSDKIVVLNKRDSNLLEQIYHRKANLILPTTFIDQFTPYSFCGYVYDFLFVGSAFFANIEGLTWFIKNVMPRVAGNLVSVGKGMEQYVRKFTQPNIEIHGSVPDIAKYYQMAKFVVMPIFSGGGMKTKVAEALMYGKTIFATKEALTGYEMREGFGEECNTPEEFINAIRKWNKKEILFNSVSRQIFEEKYNLKNTVNDIKELFQ